jgi:tRNA (guanosine-2'-O-)-methyltransferase
MDKRVEYLRNFVTDERNALFDRLINERTGYVTVVLEELYQPRNCSAILRSCDCFGVQHVHVVEGDRRFEDDAEISMGARPWLTLHRYPRDEGGTRRAVERLKAEGYRVVATTPREREVMIDDLDVARGKMAFLLGTELGGLSREAIELADEHVKVPVHGFTESYNVSVCAALLMYSVTRRLRASSIDWRLGESERQEVLLAWYMHSIKAADRILRRFEEPADPRAGLSTGSRLDDLEKVCRLQGGAADKPAVDVGAGE